MMSFSRRRDAVLCTRILATWPEFSRTTPLTMSRSRGFRLIVSGILLLFRREPTRSFVSWNIYHRVNPRRWAAARPPTAPVLGVLVEETENRLLRRGRDGQRLNGERLPRLQGDEVGALHVDVGHRHLRRTAVQGGHVLLSEARPRLQERDVRTQALGRRL